MFVTHSPRLFAVETELKQLLSEKRVTTAPQARFMRALVPAPFPLHRMTDLMPDIVVWPETTAEVLEIVKLSNRHGGPLYRVPEGLD